MLWPCLISAYILTSLLLGLMFHLATRTDGLNNPRPGELVMFFVVFSLFGIPLFLGTVLIATFTEESGNRFAKALVTKEISQS